MIILYENNLKTGKWEISPQDLADSFLNTSSSYLENVKHGWPIMRGLPIFIADNLKSSFDWNEGNNKNELEQTRQFISDKIEYYE